MGIGAIGKLTVMFGADFKGFNRAMKKAQRNLKRFGRNMQRTGQSLTRNLTMPIIGLGAVAIKTFANFEESMLKVKAVSGATASEFKLLSDNAKALGSSTMFTASQVADLQFNLAKLGFKPQEIKDATGNILALAQATSTDLAESGRIAAVALNSFNLEAAESSRIADVMALASSSAAMDMEKFGAALPLVGATARLAGDSFEGLSAKLQVLADSGMEGSSMGTHLNKIYSKLAKSGLTWNEGMQKLIDSHFDIVLAQDMFGERAFKSALILAENTAKTKEYTQANLKAAGSSQRMAAIMDSGATGAMRRLASQAEGVAITLGEMLIPILSKLMGKIKDGLDWWSSLSEENKKLSLTFAMLTAALGPALIVLGKFITLMSGTLLPFIFSATGVVAGLAAAFIYLYYNLEAITNFLANNFASEFGASFWSSLGAAMKAMGMAGGDAFLQLGTSMALVVATGEDLPEKEFKSFGEVVKEVIGDLGKLTGISGLLEPSGGTGKTKTGKATGVPFMSAQNPKKLIGPINQVTEAIEEATTAQADWGKEIKTFQGNFESSLQMAFTSQGRFFESFIANMKRAIQQQLAMIAAQRITAALFATGTGMGGVGIIGGILSGLGLASGGLVTGPTMALVGEGSGTSISNPEVVAPLDKLRGMMGGGTQNVVVEGVIRGNDIFLSNSRAGRQRQRFV